MKDWYNKVLDWMVLVAGFVNAAIISLQGLEILRVKSALGVSVSMFFFFILFQLTFALNGYRRKDKWQMWGMIASMATTVMVLIIALQYR